MTESKVAWVIGATGGIGKHVVSNLNDNGWTIVASARDENSLNELSNDKDIFTMPVDARNEVEMQETAKAIKQQHQKIDAVILAVGSIFLRPTHATTSEQFMETINQNLLTAHNTISSTARIMMKDKGGRIILFSSAAATVGMPNHGAIAAAKSGLEGLARAAAATYAKRGIRINVVSPGLTDTPLSANLLASDAAKETSNKMHPIGRYGMASEVGDVASWLASDAPDWISGETIHVDGGLSNLK